MKNNKLNIAFMFGGRSTEHEVSLTSAVGIFPQFNREKFNVTPVKVTLDGEWRVLDSSDMETADKVAAGQGRRVLLGDPSVKGLIDPVSGETIQVDVVFPILHGTYGEDGSLQGMLAMANIPCVGCGILSSALGFDKILMKQVFIQNDLQTPDFIWFLRKKWKEEPEAILRGIKEVVGYPCFVKPANTGSSVGVGKALDEASVVRAIDEACRFDRKILVEKGVNAREIECAVLGNDAPEASVLGEVIPANEFYDYDAKYNDARSKTLIPADLPEAVAERIRFQAVHAFKSLDCAGLARVDFLLEKETHEIYINEINSLPGFTPISMYPKLWEASGVSYPELLERLVDLAMERFGDLNQTSYKL